MASCSERGSSAVGSSAIDDPIDATVLLVSQVGHVGVSGTGLETAWRRIVLDDVVVPVDHPDISVGTDFGHDRRRPLVVAGEQVRGAAGLEPCAVTIQHKRADQVPGRSGHKCGAIPVGLRIAAGRVQSMAGRGGVAAVMIDLADLVGNRFEQVRVGNSRVAPKKSNRVPVRSVGWRPA